MTRGDAKAAEEDHLPLSAFDEKKKEIKKAEGRDRWGVKWPNCF